jgi:hypothetical protein
MPPIASPIGREIVKERLRNRVTDLIVDVRTRRQLQDHDPGSSSSVASALGAIGERLERDLAEREALIEAFNRSVARIATLEQQLASLTNHPSFISPSPVAGRPAKAPARGRMAALVRRREELRHRGEACAAGQASPC